MKLYITPGSPYARMARIVVIEKALASRVEIVPAQLYTYHLTIARGLSPEQPRTITKVTETT